MLTPFKKFAKKVYTSIYSQKLPELTPFEQKIIDEFKEEVEKLGNDVESVSSEEWKNMEKDIQKHILNDDIRKFLHWKTILATMNISIAGHIQKELKFLQSLKNWDSRWKESINESPIGNPSSYYLYPKSSATLIQMAYTVARYEQDLQTSVNDLDYVVEFGGGYGLMARLFYSLGFKGKYIILDLPYVSLLQTYYLKCIGLNVARSAKEFTQVLCLADIKQFSEIVSKNVLSNSLFLSTWAFSEVPLSIRGEVEDLFEKFSYYLFGYQANCFGINNVQSFYDLSKRIEKKYLNSNRKIMWKNSEITGIPDNYYLFGKELSIK